MRERERERIPDRQTDRQAKIGKTSPIFGFVFFFSFLSLMIFYQDKR